MGKDFIGARTEKRDFTGLLDKPFKVLANGAIVLTDVEPMTTFDYYVDNHSAGEKELESIPLPLGEDFKPNGCVYLEDIKLGDSDGKFIVETRITEEEFFEHKKQKKMSYSEMVKAIHEHNKNNNITSQFGDKNPLEFVIVFKASNWTENYTEKQRSYVVRSDNKAWVPDMCSNSIFADCLDGKDNGVRLDWYNWVVDYCYPVK